MKKIYESIEIEKWRELAREVQQLSFMNETDEEFQKNLEALDGMLQSIGIGANIGKRYPQNLLEIGSASFLQSIQDIHVPNHYKKATFYEKIMQLSYLGVQNIAFLPNHNNSRFEDISVRRFYDEERMKSFITKRYTDSSFVLKDGIELPEYKLYNQWYYDISMYRMQFLKNPNYLLSAELSKKDIDMNINIVFIDVYLKTFNGVYPSKSELQKFEFPELVVQKQYMKWGESPIVKERFETYDSRESSYQKRIKIEANSHEYYYE